MPSIRVMSWNIDNFGLSSLARADKAYREPKTATRQYVIDYIVSVVRQNNVQVLGLLETVGSQGERISRLLQDALPGWVAFMSSGQRHDSRHERYIILWDANAGSGILGTATPEDNPSSNWLYSTIDDSSLADFFTQIGWDRQEEIECFNTLCRSGYIENMLEVKKDEQEQIKKISIKRQRPLDIFIPDPDDEDDDDDEYEGDMEDVAEFKTVSRASRTTTTSFVELPADQSRYSFSYRVNGDAWREFRTDPDAVLELKDKDGQPTKLGLSDAQLRTLRDVLVQTDIVTFPDQGSRSPYILNLQIGTNGGNTAVLTIGAFHAPNPTDRNTLLGNSLIRLKFPGINNLSMCYSFQGDKNVLLMGDFNVESDEVTRNLEVVEYEKRELGSEGYGCWPKKYTDLQNPFDSITGFPLYARALLPNNELTSIKQFRTIIREEAPHNFARAAITYKNEPYDKFFFKSKQRDRVTATNATVVDLVKAMDASTAGVEGTRYNQNIARQGMKMYKSKLSDLLAIKYSNDIGGEDWVKFKSEMPESVPLGDTTEDRRQQFLYAQRLHNYHEYQNMLNLIGNTSNLFATLKPAAYVVPLSQTVSFFVYQSLTHHLPVMVDINIPD